MSNHHFLIKRSLAAAAVLATVGFPSAAQALRINGGGGSSGPVPVAPPAPPRVASAQPVTASGSSFQWGDAGIGAAGTIVLVAAGAGTVGVMRRRRLERPVVG
jgi:hypothetical protein